MSETINVASGLFESSLKNISINLIWKDQLKFAHYESDEYYIEVDKYMTAIHKLSRAYDIPFIKELIDYPDDENFRNLVKTIPQQYHPLIRTIREYEEHNDYVRELCGLPPSATNFISVVTEEMTNATSGKVPYSITETVYASKEYNKNDELDETLVEQWEKAPFKVNEPKECVHSGDKEYCLAYDHLPYDPHTTEIKTETRLRYIHELSEKELLQLSALGYIDKELEKYPENKYLNHLIGERRLYPFEVREAKRFDLMYVPDTDPSVLRTHYIETYERCKNYAIRVFYTEAFRPMGSLYEGFIAMLISFMTMQQMYTRYLDADITRDFYDVDSLKLVYDAYGVPFYNSIPIRFHLDMVKKINRLISYKGTDQVIVDLCKIFSYEIMGIYRYYLLKERKISGGTPLTISQDDYDKLSDKEKLDKLYDIKFVKSRNESHGFASLLDNQNIERYEEVTYGDPYWINDGDLYSALYRNQFNYIETKYLGIQLSFNMAEMLFESIYYMRIFMDNRDVFQLSYVIYSLTGDSVSLFDLVIYLYAAICEMHYRSEDPSQSGENIGYIPSSPTKVSRILGFNFKDDLTTLQALADKIYYEQVVVQGIPIDEKASDKNDNFILKAKRLDSIRKQIKKCDVNSYDSVCVTYDAIKELFNLIGDSISAASSIEEYKAYKEMYKTFMTTEIIDEVITKSDGSKASTYKELLEDINPTLYSRLMSPDIDLNNEISYCIAALEKYCTHLKYIEYIAYDTSVIVDFLYKLINFFKSAKAQLLDFNVLFIIDSRIDNLLKMIDQVNWSSTTWLEEYYEVFLDYISSTTNNTIVKSKGLLSDGIFKINE